MLGALCLTIGILGIVLMVKEFLTGEASLVWGTFSRFSARRTVQPRAFWAISLWNAALRIACIAAGLAFVRQP
ncbi:hypothetical protein WBP07_13190 [Novosphingobium sp. BL-8A]|uniref:hypothetical protein n=1 Tax=Novosphingobium sp. BL-8A TaxID=3127639 RepID=UPI0037570267